MVNIKNKNITVFGDSITKGVIIDNGKIKKVEHNAVSIIENHYAIKINNISYFGQTLKRAYDKGLIANYFKTIDKNKDNVLIIALGGNDSDYDWEKVSIDPKINHSSKTTLPEFKELLNKINDLAKNNNVYLCLVNLFPLDSQRYFDNVLSSKYNGENILKFLDGDVTNLSRHQEYFNSAIYEFAIKNNIHLFDIRSPFLLKNDFLSNLYLDGIHPNQLGQIEIANILINQIDNFHK